MSPRPKTLTPGPSPKGEGSKAKTFLLFTPLPYHPRITRRQSSRELTRM